MRSVASPFTLHTLKQRHADTRAHTPHKVHAAHSLWLCGLHTFGPPPHSFLISNLERSIMVPIHK